MTSKMKVLTVLLGIFALSAGQEGRGDAELMITPMGDSHTRPLYSSFVFTCTMSGLGSPDIDPILKWYDKDDIEITVTTGRMYIESDGKQILKLYFTSIENQDSGFYSCSGTVSGAKIEKRVELLIYKDITFDHAPSPQHPRIYTDALIECRVSGQPTPQVSWRYRGQTITTGDRYIQEQYGLRIRNITLEDDGRYTCRAEVAADGRYEKKDIDVYVHIPPKMTEGPGDVEGIENHEVSITCSASGHPAPKYEFYKDDNDNPVSETERIKVDRDKGVIDFKPLNRDDKGDYRCVAINDVGEAEITGSLYVLVKPHIHRYLNVTATEGNAATIECLSEGEPAPSITFRKVGNDYDYEEGSNEGGRINVRTVNAGHTEMTVTNTNADDTANYTCQAINEAGESKQNGTITVQYKPFFEMEQEPVYSWAGKTRNMSCVVRAEPEPVIKWYRFDYELKDNETFRVYHMYKSSNLQIRVQEVDQGWIYGNYRCEATNQLGVGEQEIELRRARVPGEPKEVNIILSTPTSLELAIVPPDDDGGVRIFGYSVEYDGYVADFNVGQPVLLEALRASTAYVFFVRAKNEVGPGTPLTFSHTTEDIREPFPIVIISNPEGLYPFEYDLNWEKPRTGGLDIIQYEFNFRRVKNVDSGANTINKPEDNWVRRLVDDDPVRPMLFYKLEGLVPNSQYEVIIRARNNVGWSMPNTPNFKFRTAEADPIGAVGGGSTQRIDCWVVLGSTLLLMTAPRWLGSHL